MKILGTLCTLALFLFLIAPAPGYSQDREENKPNQPRDEQKPNDNDKARENGRKQEDKATRPDDNRRNENSNKGRQDERERQPEASRPQDQQQRDQQERDQRNQGREQRPSEQQRQMDNDHRAAQGNERNDAGNRGRRIPDDQFRTHFGREHHFHVQREQVVNVSQPVVVYGGYSWQLAEPWPSDWSYDDDCYIDDVDGEYFMFDALHPGIRIAVFIAE